ncbi:MAG: hypothetical protein ACI9GW_002764 [Halieaceae bacterium]|jgi:hypothetical protein
MNDSNVSPEDYQVEECELCVLGAGIAGINALFAGNQQKSSSNNW